MIAFILDMPGKGSWNNQWSGEGKLYVKFKSDNEVPKEYIGQSFTYRWPDGWVASIKVEKMPSNEANKMKKKSAGFCGYDWMINSIINHGSIITPEDFIEEYGTEEQKFILEICQLIGVGNHDKDFTIIRDFHIYRKDLEVLLENNLINESDELYSGGPTINDILKFRTRYEDELYILTAKAEHKTIIYTSFYKNNFDKINREESAKELDQLFKNVPSIDIMYDGTKQYKFI